MNQSNEQDRDVFVVQHDGQVATIHLHRSPAGWTVHVMTATDPNGDTVYFGYALGVFQTLEQARGVGSQVAVQRIEAHLGRALSGGGFTLRGGAIERANEPGNFDAVIEVWDSNDQVTDRHFIKIINGVHQERPQAVETARRALHHVSGVSDQGKLII